MNQKRKNGFTLIELLAVIVILAIIALIAVPVILNIIDKANKSAFKDTAYGVISAGELYFAERQLELNGMQGNVEIELPDSRLQLKGDIPEGKVLITTEGKVSIAVQNGRYCVKKGLDDTDVTVTDDITNCNLPSGNGGSGGTNNVSFNYSFPEDSLPAVMRNNGNRITLLVPDEFFEMMEDTYGTKEELIEMYQYMDVVGTYDPNEFLVVGVGTPITNITKSNSELSMTFDYMGDGYYVFELGPFLAKIEIRKVS